VMGGSLGSTPVIGRSRPQLAGPGAEIFAIELTLVAKGKLIDDHSRRTRETGDQGLQLAQTERPLRSATAGEGPEYE
jgi:hypothetical protein